MRIKFNIAGLGRSRPYEYVIRFAFGGTVTAFAGLVAQRFGPEIGGLFLAFPAILPAAATLIEKHEKKKDGEKRGREAAGVDAAGAAMGSIGLIAFALIAWQRLTSSTVGSVLSAATLVWLVTSVCVWELREILRRRVRANRSHASHHRQGTPTRPVASTNRRLHE